MGTNYFWRHNICTCCNRYDQMHICKSLVSFEGHFSKPDWDVANSRPIPALPLVTSWAEWKGVIRAGGEVWDEYGVRHDVEEFIARVEATDPAVRRRQYEWCVEHPDRVPVRDIDRVGERGEWLDADGFSFYGGEFS